MASHKSTPKSILEAPERTYEIKKGTSFNGMNRKELRAVGHKGGGAKPQARTASLKRPKHWVVTEREARVKAALAALDTGSDD
jgi:hypothetical protein